jgi:hypothetical protein
VTITGIDALTFGVTDLDEAHRFAADWGLLQDPADASRYTQPMAVRSSFGRQRTQGCLPPLRPDQRCVT